MWYCGKLFKEGRIEIAERVTGDAAAQTTVFYPLYWSFFKGSECPWSSRVGLFTKILGREGEPPLKKLQSEKS